MPGQKFVHIQLNAENWTCRLNEKCNYTRQLKDVVDLVKHIRWHLKDAHQGRKLIKFHYSFFIQQSGKRIYLTDQELSKWQNEANSTDPFIYFQRNRISRVLVKQEELDLEQIVKRVKKEKTETGLRQNIWLLQKYNGCTSPKLIQAYAAMVEKLEGLESSCQDLMLDSFCTQMIESQIEYRSDTMDFFIVQLLMELWKTEIFNISSFYFHFSSTIRTLFERDNQTLKSMLRQVFILMNNSIEEMEEPKMMDWVKENLTNSTVPN